MKNLALLLFIAGISLSAYAQDDAMEEVYQSKCAMCHGRTAGQLGPSPVAINTLTTQRIETRLKNARDKDEKHMTAQDKVKATVSESQANDLAAYISSLKK